MQQIAVAVGVSKATVSLALRDDARITPAVRAKVRAAAAAAGYRPNPLVAVHMAHLRTSQAPQWRATLGYLVHLTKDQWARNRLRPEGRCHTGAAERARALGYTLEIFWLAEAGMTAARMTGILASRGVPGVIVAPWPRAGLADPLDLDWSQFAAATVGYAFQEPNLHRACHDNYSTMGRALAELARRGYARVGFAAPAEDDERVNHLWLARFLAFQAALPPRHRVAPLLTREWNRESFLRWVRRAKPDVLVTTRSGDAPEWLARARLGPEKIGVLSVFWRREVATCSGFDQNFELLGASTIDLVVAQLQRNERGLPAAPKIMLLPGEWREGATLRRAPVAAVPDSPASAQRSKPVA